MIDPATLTPEQYAGIACVVDGHPVYAGAIRVGVLGEDGHFVYACPGMCARKVDGLVMERQSTRSTYSAGRPANPPAGRPAVPTVEVSR